jgi:uncharacterized protein
MRISLRRLRLLPGEEQLDRPTVVIEPLVLGGQEYAVEPREITTVLTIQRATSGFALRLQLDAGVHGPCMRCLEDALLPIAVDAREYHDLDPGGDEELVSDYVVDDEIDAAGWARDALALALPDPILCRPDCAGLCPVCGRNLNLEPHVHEEIATDSRWAALEGLALEGLAPEGRVSEESTAAD